MKLGELVKVLPSDGIKVLDGSTGKLIARRYGCNVHTYDDADVFRLWPDMEMGRMVGYQRSMDMILCCYISHSDYIRLKQGGQNDR